MSHTPHPPRAIVHFPDDGNLLNAENIAQFYDELQDQISKHLSPDIDDLYDPAAVAIIPSRFVAKRARNTAVFTIDITADPACEALRDLDGRMQVIAENVLNSCGWIKDMAGTKDNIDLTFGDSRAVV